MEFLKQYEILFKKAIIDLNVAKLTYAEFEQLIVTLYYNSLSIFFTTPIKIPPVRGILLLSLIIH